MYRSSNLVSALALLLEFSPRSLVLDLVFKLSGSEHFVDAATTITITISVRSVTILSFLGHEILALL